MLTGFLTKHQREIGEICSAHPLVSFVAVQFLAAAGMIAAVGMIACLGAVPVYFLSQFF